MCILSSTDPLGRSCKCSDQLLEVTERDGGSSVCRMQTTTPLTCPLNCNQGLCKILNGTPKCKCTIDYDGEFCEHYRCSGYCKNRGVCYVDASKAKAHSETTKPPLKCKCSSLWTGDRCEIPVANCTSPCYNGVCTVKRGRETCTCSTGFTGAECQHCDDLECQNDGICRKDHLGNSKCECTKDFKGIRCESSPCEGYCSGHGQCTIQIHSGSPQCECETGYWGNQCESEECTGYCLNSGSCAINPVNVKICACLPNYTGTRCEIYIDNPQILSDCSNFDCENGGICHYIKNEAYCNCTAQFTGTKCQVKIL